MRKKNSPPPKEARPKKRLNLELTANPRLAAFRVLAEAAQGRTPEESLVAHGRLLSPRDLGLATALVYEVLRHKAYLERLAKDRLSSGRAGEELMIVLSLGLAQLFYFDRLGEHAAVSESVALAKTVLPGRQGLVNAILRGFLRDRDAGKPWPPQLPPEKDPAAHLALKHSYQNWFVRRLLKSFPPAEAEEILAAGNRPTPPTLRLNPLKGSREELAAALPFDSQPTALSPWGLKAASFSGRPEDWPGFAEGLFAVQDEASQLLGLIVGELPEGAAVLDVCAGLGGKALHLAALNPRAAIVAQDKDEAKLELLRNEARRLACPNVRTEEADILLSPPPADSFDLVLVDAPCSGLGVMRRRPDLKWNKREEDLARLAGLQLKLLTAASAAVRPGGRLIYGVCSFSPEEGPGVAGEFLKARPDFASLAPDQWPEILGPLVDENGGLTLWPHRHDTDGFFWAVFTRRPL